MITYFPEFLPLSVVNAEEYHQYVAPYPPYADFNLTNRLSWDIDGTTAVSLLHDNLVLRLPDYAHGGTRITLLGTSKLERTIETLLRYRQAGSNSPQLELVPEFVVQRLPVKSAWYTEEDINNNDHVLSVPRLVTMDGPSMRHCRRAVQSFKRKYEPVAAFHKLDLTCSLTQEAILQVFISREACKQRNDATFELRALQRLFSIVDQRHLTAYGISIRGALRAFIICEPMNATWVIGHFWKADATFTGIYSYLMHCIADRVAQQGMVCLNSQQDLGIEGLRTFKQSLAPVMQLRKYTLRQQATTLGAARLPETLRH